MMSITGCGSLIREPVTVNIRIIRKEVETNEFPSSTYYVPCPLELRISFADHQDNIVYEEITEENFPSSKYDNLSILWENII